MFRIMVAHATLLLYISTATAQHHDHSSGHAQFHAFYQNWVNREAKGCCNDRDCKPLHEDAQREIRGIAEILVHGVGVAKNQAAWCPILPRHYLSRGNAPNWNVAHACITDYYGGRTPCEQFICYQPKPAF